MYVYCTVHVYKPYTSINTCMPKYNTYCTYTLFIVMHLRWVWMSSICIIYTHILYENMFEYKTSYMCIIMC